MGIERGLFNRTELLVGADVMDAITAQRVIIFGVGGVGSWCAECLVRSGVAHLTIVDSDRVCVTNINRQLMATTHTVGKVKVEALRDRLLEINPKADIVALQKIYNEDSADDFNLDEYDYVIDAIDSLKDKALLILRACQWVRLSNWTPPRYTWPNSGRCAAVPSVLPCVRSSNTCVSALPISSSACTATRYCLTAVSTTVAAPAPACAPRPRWAPATPH